ncbi:MAG: polysaccharide lyase family 1 protein [Treponema sp.]|nr:polysaccharide lyase family 1 protein [Treponema sp.]
MKKTFAILTSVLSAYFMFIACETTDAAKKKSAAPQPAQIAFTKPESISAKDLPDGFAAEGFSAKIDYGASRTVSTKAELLDAVKKGGVIYVNGMIDLSDGMLPGEPGGSTPALDAFVKQNSRFSTYDEFKKAYVAACSLTTNDQSKGPQSSLYSTLRELENAYYSAITLQLKSNTVLIGLTNESGFVGGMVSITNVSNVILRNLTILNAYDPFPHHESGDGYNADPDNVHIEIAKNVWVDHCTLGDTIGVSHVLTGGKDDEKWQTFDGVCDIKGASNNITVSYCKFMNHDKTMLIGASDSESISPEARRVTIHHNYFYNCGQRIPMVRLTTVHTYNNYIDMDKTATYKNNYALGVRYNALVQSENNYFGSGISYSYSGHTSKQGTVYVIGDLDKSSSGRKPGQVSFSKSALFTIPYAYATISAKEVPDYVKANAGAGVIPVTQ